MTKRKWRPTLSMIVAAMIAVALLLPLTGVLFFRLLENQLIRNTEAELIGQSAAIAAAMSAFLEARSGAGIPLGPAIERPSLPEGERWAPTLPALDLGDAKILPERPDAKAATTAVAPAYAEVGAFLYPVLVRTQQATLAGFRVLDFNGVVIAGRSETGKSLAHVPEVEAALKGDYVSVMRSRTIEDPQPIYSISRGTKVRIFSAFPVFVGDRLAGVVYASRTPSNVVKEFYFLRGKLAVLALVVIGVAGAMVIIFARAISGPIHELSARATRIGEGDRAAIGPMVHYGSREVHRLSNELMAMSRKLFDRNDYINTFTAHVSHELKSPLTSIRGAVELLAEGEMSPDERAKFLDNIARDTERGTALLDRLRALARADSVAVGGASTLGDLAADARGRFPDLDIVVDGEATVPMSPENAGIILDNLLDNAAHHGATRVEIRSVADDGAVTLQIADNGRGISPGNAAQIFDLFFTTRRDTGGTGLGLGIVAALLRSHKGRIALVPSEKGACFELTIPMA